MPAALPRRDLLRLAGLAGATAVLVACTDGGGGGGSTSPGAPDDPDLALRREVAADEAALSALYAETAPGLPAALRTAVTALGARHADYRAAVLGGGSASPDPTGASAGGSSSDGSSPSPTGPGAASPSAAGGSTAARLARLRAAETKAAAARAAQSVRAQDRELARTIVLAGTGAAGAAEVLRGLP